MSETQREFIGFFGSSRRTGRPLLSLEQRVQISSRRFRIPDVCVFVGRRPKDQIFHEPPFICIEIMSPEDRIERMQSKIDDYLNFGVAYVWVINPRTRRAWVHTKDSISEAKDGVLKTENPDLTVPLAEIFAGIDE